MHVHIYVCIYNETFKAEPSPFKKKPVKNDEKCFLFHFKGSLRSQDI